MGLGNLQKMAMQMQRDMARVEEELKAAHCEGSAGGGVVKAVVSGKAELQSLTLDPSVVDPDDIEMLQDLVVAAISEAMNAAHALEQQKMAAVTGGLRLPGM